MHQSGGPSDTATNDGRTNSERQFSDTMKAMNAPTHARRDLPAPLWVWKLLPDATPRRWACLLRVHLQSMAPRVATRQGDGSDFGALPMVAHSSAVLAPDGAVSAPDGAVLALARKEDKNPSMKPNNTLRGRVRRRSDNTPNYPEGSFAGAVWRDAPSTWGEAAP